MSADRLEIDFCCSECNKYFESASFLLAHFAFHASQVNNTNESSSNKSDKKSVPDLYPINVVKNIANDNNENVVNTEEFISKTYLNPNDSFENHESNNSSEHLDTDFNPLKYCAVSMEVKEHHTSINEEKASASESATKKKYPCTFCPKVFGWSTDLKRHILTHTGQRPFKCRLCDASFTRNFLLQKHEGKTHANNSQFSTKHKLKMPSLKPIFAEVEVKSKTKDSRKQDKQKIKRKCNFLTENKLLKLNFIDKETIVQ